MNMAATEDMNYLAQQPPGKLNMILAGMTALMNDIGDKASAMESQNWFQRMAKTVTGKNKLTLAEIQQNHEKLNAYMSEAIAELYNRNCIDHKVMMSLGVQINELYADHIQLKQMLGAFVNKLNEKIDSVDNFHMLITEIDHGVYSSEEPIVSVCKVMSQFDNRILEDGRKLDIISRSLRAQGILNGEQMELTEYLAVILGMPMDDMGQIYLELGTIRNNFMASVILGVMESYYFLPDLARKMKNKEALIREVIQAEQLDASVSLSMEEIYGAFLESKLDVKNGLVPIGEVGSFNRETPESNGRDDAETTELGITAFCEDNYSQAVEYFRDAAENGYAEAQDWLGTCYEIGEGVAEDSHEAFKWYMKAAQQDFPYAQYHVGKCYYSGYGVAKNKSEAFKWYMKAAQQDDPSAQNSVGCCYSQGKGVTKNKSEAFKWYIKAAEQDFPSPLPQYNVGICYDYGEGVTKNKSEAFKWYMKAAEQDFPDAQCRVGICYDYGEGVTKNKSEAFKWYMKAAQQGDAHAQFCVGSCYDNGEGVAPSVYEPFKWYMKAAEQGHIEAQSSVGKCYHSGIGTEQNYQIAKKWLKKAAEQGSDSAKDRLWKWYHEVVY